MKSLKELIYEALDLNSIPEDTSLNLEDIQEYAGIPKYSSYRYFGDCKNTINIDHMWDTTQMSNWIHSSCKVISPIEVLDKISDGDRKIPKKALRIIDKLKKDNELENTAKIVCALDDHQKIMFIYLSETDTHYFFDCE